MLVTSADNNVNMWITTRQPYCPFQTNPEVILLAIERISHLSASDRNISDSL